MYYNFLLIIFKSLTNITLELPWKKAYLFSFILQWATLFDGFMIEAKWLSGGQVPTREDYLRNGIITSGAPLLFMHLLFMLGHDLTEENNDHMSRIISCPAKIMRLWDDMGSAKVRTHEKLWHAHEIDIQLTWTYIHHILKRITTRNFMWINQLHNIDSDTG